MQLTWPKLSKVMSVCDRNILSSSQKILRWQKFVKRHTKRAHKFLFSLRKVKRNALLIYRSYSSNTAFPFHRSLLPSTKITTTCRPFPPLSGLWMQLGGIFINIPLSLTGWPHIRCNVDVPVRCTTLHFCPVKPATLEGNGLDGRKSPCRAP